ncbi:hypothetical protein BDK51DRAFT_27886 [Blyttiomyces helicus]|uniref:Uncharacterized protein n=1 Tax=Blyttiomyces helicus TaxID=388810 RepID=A0A4P9WA97_9FUNG|nr:hypothetical protein BDK51DRAFT_27886 [Blyttiomyces helicus]|eukprot:RKO89354.1 hypothetical protein BDK51DRAFT_27886 [Blyttiomyces helicus]
MDVKRIQEILRSQNGGDGDVLTGTDPNIARLQAEGMRKMPEFTKRYGRRERGGLVATPPGPQGMLSDLLGPEELPARFWRLGLKIRWEPVDVVFFKSSEEKQSATSQSQFQQHGGERMEEAQTLPADGAVGACEGLTCRNIEVLSPLKIELLTRHPPLQNMGHTRASLRGNLLLDPSRLHWTWKPSAEDLCKNQPNQPASVRAKMLYIDGVSLQCRILYDLLGATGKTGSKRFVKITRGERRIEYPAVAHIAAVLWLETLNLIFLQGVLLGRPQRTANRANSDWCVLGREELVEQAMVIQDADRLQEEPSEERGIRELESDLRTASLARSQMVGHYCHLPASPSHSPRLITDSQSAVPHPLSLPATLRCFWNSHRKGQV